MKPKLQSSVLSFSGGSSGQPGQISAETIDQLGELARALLRDEHLEVSKVRPFFWSLVETYVDRFQVYPFDVMKALFSYLELREYPEAEISALVQQLEALYLRQHGRRLEKTEIETGVNSGGRDTQLRDLCHSLKYAAMLGKRES